MAVAGKTVARPVNLAQASQSRLGETNRDSLKPVCAKGRPGNPLRFLSEQTSRPGERGETFRVALQWSGRNSMAPVSGSPWWCPICIISSRSSSSGSSRGIHQKCKHPLNLTKLYLTRFVAWLCCMWLFFLAMIINLVDGSRWARFSRPTREWRFRYLAI
ncbi:hypothetical protein DEO72_LG10g2423 [Vigna unguiculata]|uniref:Uncharacterized protein n=1 Tax=Vigna unguiculata TaxID=3917 RepID=A0A4D6NBC2_VIGUN|nr:hypothetical protein DEO72_LG10g2423 [Vigna unguiculata]